MEWIEKLAGERWKTRPLSGNGRRPATHQASGRERLEFVASDLFAQRHFNSVSIKDIGKAASVNPAMIYYYFKEKARPFPRGA